MVCEINNKSLKTVPLGEQRQRATNSTFNIHRQQITQYLALNHHPLIGFSLLAPRYDEVAQHSIDFSPEHPYGGSFPRIHTNKPQQSTGQQACVSE